MLFSSPNGFLPIQCFLRIWRYLVLSNNLLIYLLCIRSHISHQEIYILPTGREDPNSHGYTGSRGYWHGKARTARGIQRQEGVSVELHLVQSLSRVFLLPSLCSRGIHTSAIPFSYESELHRKVMKTQPKEFTLRILSVTLATLVFSSFSHPPKEVRLAVNWHLDK